MLPPGSPSPRWPRVKRKHLSPRPDLTRPHLSSQHRLCSVLAQPVRPKRRNGAVARDDQQAQTGLYPNFPFSACVQSPSPYWLSPVSTSVLSSAWEVINSKTNVQGLWRPVMCPTVVPSCVGCWACVGWL